jgi:hypothetical protein
LQATNSFAPTEFPKTRSAAKPDQRYR